MSTPRLTDRDALAMHRSRAASAPATFLHDEAIAQVQERLEEINRPFTRPAIVTGHPAPWARAFPGARVVADEAALALEAGAHDLVVHGLALHWSDDPVGQLVQMRRALVPDGLMIAVLFGGRTLFELRTALAEAEVAATGGLSPRIAPMGEVRDLGGLLQRAGYALPVADSVALTVTHGSTLGLMHDLRAMGETNALARRDRRFGLRDLFARTASIHGARFGDEAGRICTTFELVFLTGWSPSENQPRPLRPGSAKARLAEALGVPETGLHDPASPRRD